MAMRVCEKCKSAENPLGRLRFKKSRVDGKIYCENCTPVTHSIDLPDDLPPELPAEKILSGAPRGFPRHKPSAGYVVIDCPACAGGVHRPHGKPCDACSGYGAVRMEIAMLNVYRPPSIKMLTED